jgi:hypothetical protein
MIIDREYLSDEMEQRLAEPADVFEGDDVSFLKEENSSTAAVMTVKNKRYAVKRFNVKNILLAVKQALLESRASKSWRNAHLLQIRGIPTARPVAIVECFSGRQKGVSLYVTEFIDGVDSARFFNDMEISIARKRKVAKAMLDMIFELKKQQLVHGKVGPADFVILGDQPVLVDLDSMRHIRRRFFRQRAFRHQLDMFMQNWQDMEPAGRLFEELLSETSTGQE